MVALIGYTSTQYTSRQLVSSFFLSGIKAIKVDTVERLFIEVQGSLQVEGIQYISSKSPVINFVVVYYKICTSGAGLTMDSKKMDRKLMTRAAAT